MNKNLKILIADELPTMRRITKNLLADLGFNNSHEAQDGAMALNMLNKGDFELVITEWDLPNVAGIDLLKSIRSDNELKSLPVIIVTAEVERQSIISAQQAGVNGYIVKPFTAAILKKNLQRIF